MTSPEDVESATLKHPPGDASDATSTDFELVVSKRSGSTGARILVDAGRPGRLFVGQSPSSDLRLADPAVSRRHAAFEIVGASLRVTDLSSTNGTFVNEVRVIEALLDGGETVRVGGTHLTVKRAALTESIALPAATGFGRVIGASLAMRRLYPLCERLAASDVPVIVEGETGTGKELLAEALHEQGARAAGPFVVFDCTAVPAELFESALFGHERGAFTGAVAARRGAVEQADRGTLLIDEIGELALPLQAKLLRAIERGEVQRVGSENWTRVNVRVIAATRRDLDDAVAKGTFRDDLYYRLGVARLELPPLSRRAGDVELLVRRFWAALGGPDPIPGSFVVRAIASAWPGNIRQLRNAVARQIALGSLDTTTTSDGDEPLDPAVETTPAVERVIERVLESNLPLPRARQIVVEHFERRYLERVLAMHNGNVRRAAESSGVARRYFQLLRARIREKGD